MDTSNVIVVDPIFEPNPVLILDSDDARFILALVPHAELYTRPLALRFAAIDIDERAAEELLASLN